MTPEQARRMVEECKEETLALDDLHDLDVATAEELAKFGGDLSFPRLRTIQPEAAEKLVAVREVPLLIDEGFELPSTLCRTLFLDGLEELSSEVAIVLARHNDALSLNGLTKLSLEVAKALAGHRGALSLDGLESLKDPGGPAEAPQDWVLLFRDLDNGLHNESLAEVLATSQATRLSLNGLRSLSPEEAGCLASSEDEMTFSLNGLQSLEKGAAECLAALQGELHLEGINALSLDEVLHFACQENQCEVCFGNEFLTEAVSEARKVYRAWDESRVIDHDGTWFDNQPYGMVIESSQLTVDEARLLGGLSQGIWQRLGQPRVRFWASLALPNLRELDCDLADELAKHRGILCLDALESISDAAAQSLARHDGPLTLNGLELLSVYQAQVLAEHGHQLELNSLMILDYYAAKALAEGRCSLLTLYGLYASADVYAVLQRNEHIRLQA